MRVTLCLLLTLLALPPLFAAGAGVVSPLPEAALQLAASSELRAVDVFDGRAGATVRLTKAPNGWRSVDGNLTVAVRPEKLRDRTNWFVQIANDGTQSAWLLVRGYRTAPLRTGWRYFNGNFSAAPRQPVVRSLLPYTMPVVGVYDSTAGVALGIEPMQIFSYIENGFIPAAAEGAFYYGVKLVVDPGKPETVQFVTYSCAPAESEPAFVAAYHALYPAAFSPIPDGDPRLQTSGESGSAATWYQPSPEATRRSFTRCDWCYAPVKIPGDWFGRSEFWDKYNENVADEKKLKERYGTLEHWHDYLRQTFTRVNLDHGTAPYFYIINWTYYRLAEEYYRDAMVTDPKAQNRIGPWVTNKGPDVRVFLWGNKHAEQFQQDLRDLWAAYPLSGFGHDVTLGDVKYRGPAIAVSPGRAWDAEGEYCDVSVCIAKTADFIHALPKKQYRAGFWGNGAEHIYSVAVRCDAGSFEGARYELAGLDPQSRYRRYILGGKAIQLFSGDSRDHTADYYDEENTPPADIKLMYRRIAVSSVQTCLKWGLLPCSDLALGWQETWEWAELADRELFPYPWQLLTGAIATNGLTVARYGCGADARFVVINERGVPAETVLTIQPRTVGASVVYALADGTATVNEPDQGLLKVKVSLPPAGVAFLLPVAQATAPLTTPVTAARTQDPVDGLRLKLEAGANKLKPLIPTGYEVAADSSLHFSPTLFAGTEKQLLDFFGGPETIAMLAASRIVIRPGEGLAERKSAEAVQEYFRFYSEEVLQKPRVVIPITTEASAGPQVRIVITPQERIALTAETLTIQAPEARLLDVTRGLLRLLDRRYPFYGQIGRWVHQRPIETKLRQSLGLAGGTVLKDGTILQTPLTAAIFHQFGKGPAYGKPW